MAQHDFAPAWLNFPTLPSTTKSSLRLEKHPENVSWTENRYEANRRRHNSSDGCHPNTGRPNGGKKEKNSWRSHGKHSTGKNHHEGYYGAGYRAHTSTFHYGKGQGLHDTNVPDRETGKKGDKVVKQFKAEDFPSLNPEYEREPKQSKSLAAGVWEYPLNPNSRSQRMLVMKKGSTKEMQVSGVSEVGSLYSQPVKNGTGTSVYKGLVPKPVTPPAKPTQWKSQAKENKRGNPFPHDSVYGAGNFNPFKSTAKMFAVSQNSEKERNRSNSSSPVDKIGQPRLTKLTRMRTDKKSEFLKELKQNKVEEDHKDKNHSGQEKDDESSNLHNSNSPHQERDTKPNFENDNLQENGNASVTSQQVTQSSSSRQAEFFSISLEAEHRLLKQMGWQEDNENDETYAPLTEDEMKEFQIICEKFKKNGLRKNGILKNGLTYDFKFNPWKNSTFKPAPENEDSETSSSDTSDDDDM